MIPPCGLVLLDVPGVFCMDDPVDWEILAFDPAAGAA